MKRSVPGPVVVSFETILQSLGNESAAKATTSALDQFPDNVRVGLQAGLEAGLAALEDEPGDKGVMSAPNFAPAALLQSFLAERAAEEGKVEETPTGAYEAKFDSKDWTGWAGSFLSWWHQLKKHDWLRPSDQPDPMPNDARIAMLADWGTGLYGAPICARSIMQAKQPPHVVLHLGDVYYSGLPKEVQTRFLDLFPFVPGALCRATNSNHEMYSGGGGYFGKTLPALKQQASCFALENDHWLLVGLDTGYEEHDLFGDQVAWFDRLLLQAKQKNQRVIVVSHHQPFSVFEKQGKKLVEKLGARLRERRVFAWYWGHEHRCALHDKHPDWQMWGACIGHSGFPYFRDKVDADALNKKNDDGTSWYRVKAPDGVPGTLLLDGSNPYLGEHADRYGPNGFMTLQLGKDSLKEWIHAADGTVLFTRELT